MNTTPSNPEFENKIVRNEDGQFAEKTHDEAPGGSESLPVFDTDRYAGYETCERFWQEDTLLDDDLEVTGGTPLTMVKAGPYAMSVYQTLDNTFIVEDLFYDTQNDAWFTMPRSGARSEVTSTVEVRRLLDGWAETRASSGLEAQRKSDFANAVGKGLIPTASAAARSTDAVMAVYELAEEQFDGNVIKAADAVGAPCLSILRQRFRDEDVVDGDINYRSEDVELIYPDTFAEAIRTMKDTGVGSDGYDPDGSQIIDYRTGEREEVHVGFLGFWDVDEEAFVRNAMDSPGLD